MTDTTPDVQDRFDELMRQRSGSERVRMMSEMFELGKALVLSSLREMHPGSTDTEMRVLLFDRLYGNELDLERRTSVIARLREQGQVS